jgi:thioredoxin-dependent peroxiredoxin
MSALAVGDAAPDFDLAADGGGRVRLSDLKGKTVVLYLYPKDDTPGCTKEAQGFSAAAAEFAKAGAVVVGLSKDSVASHDKFKKKYDLNLHLASDPEGALIEALGSWVEKSMYGKVYFGIDRSTFLIDKAGRVARIWHKVKVPGHVEEVLAAAQAIA